MLGCASVGLTPADSATSVCVRATFDALAFALAFLILVLVVVKVFTVFCGF